MTILSNTYGIAARNFTAYPEMPDAKGLIDYGMRVEELGYDSLWVWDHILLGVEPHFPILDSLTTLMAIGARTSRIKLGTGILVLPLRNPVALAKQLSSMDQFSGGRLIMGMASGWYKREFDAMGIPFTKRGKLMDENLDLHSAPSHTTGLLPCSPKIWCGYYLQRRAWIFLQMTCSGSAEE
jgi:alkanesulfonate monooxygenase